MKRFNNRVAIWGMLSMFVLSAVTFPGALPFVAEANAESAYQSSEKKNESKTEADAEAKIVRDIRAEIFGVPPIQEEILVMKEAQQVTMEAINVQVVAAQEPSEWDAKVIAKVTDEVNIRESADAQSGVVGHLRSGNHGDILEAAGEWTKISSGTVIGYVSNEFLAFGAEAEALANQQGKTATVTTETLRVRRQPKEESEIADLVSAGAKFSVVEELDGWIGVTLSSGGTGYVKGEFVCVERNISTAISIEEEQAAIRAAQEKAAKEAAAKEAKRKKSTSGSTSVATTQRAAAEVSVDETTLLGALVQVEAGGESYEGKLAVASVVMNRVNSSKYPNTISGVIYQRGQFPGAHNGLVAKVIAKGVKSSCIEAAQDAIAGKNNIGNYLYFNNKGAVNTSTKSSYTIIGNQCFY